MAANTWAGGDVFYRLRIFDLDPKKKYVLLEPEAGRLFAPAANNRTWTAQQLQAGAIVQTGAHRISCFVVEEYRNGQKYGTLIAPDEVAKAMETRRPVADPFSP